VIPLSETFGYATVLRSLTQGRGTHTLEFYRYQEVPVTLAEELTKKATGKRYA
jgi:elongation factor G